MILKVAEKCLSLQPEKNQSVSNRFSPSRKKNWVNPLFYNLKKTPNLQNQFSATLKTISKGGD